MSGRVHLSIILNEFILIGTRDIVGIEEKSNTVVRALERFDTIELVIGPHKSNSDSSILLDQIDHFILVIVFQREVLLLDVSCKGN